MKKKNPFICFFFTHCSSAFWVSCGQGVVRICTDGKKNTRTGQRRGFQDLGEVDEATRVYLFVFKKKRARKLGHSPGAS